MAPRSHRARHAAPTRAPFAAVVAVLVLIGAGVFVWRTGVLTDVLRRDGGASSSDGTPTPAPGTSRSTVPTTVPTTPSPSPTPTGIRTPGPINTKFPGLTTFRGNAARDYYGEGPVPKHPEVLWQYPESGAMCASSTAGNETKQWCGTGWTGQPNVIPHPDGTIEIREGAYDDHYHFLDGKTGKPIRPDLVTGDLAKGSATSDPDGYPLYYGGSRDNYLRVVALDRPEPTVLWQVNSQTSVPNPVWNSDWDGAPLVVGDYLLEGGENSWFYVIKLNRHYDSKHLVQVNPRIVMTVPGWDDQLLADLPDNDISIEDSVAFFRGVVYFANSGGLVQGWDIRNVLHGGTHYKRVLRFWTGDDTDASIVIDPQGFLYVASEYQRFNARSREVGQIMKLDPRKPDDPLVWGVAATQIAFENAGGSWGTPALYGTMLYDTTASGDLLAINRFTGKVVWSVKLAPPTVGSPVPVDDVLIVGDCAGVLHGFDISKPKVEPKELWRVQLGGCIESTPAVWHGMIWVGARGGKFYGIGDRP